MEENKSPAETISEDFDKVMVLIGQYQSIREERVKTILTLQGLLFVALGFSWDKDAVLPVMISIGGFVASLAIIH